MCACGIAGCVGTEAYDPPTVPTYRQISSPVDLSRIPAQRQPVDEEVEAR